MLVITQAITKQLVQHHIVLEWTIKSTSEVLADYRLAVLRAQVQSPSLADFEYVVTGINPQVTTYYDDHVYGITSKTVDYFYKIQVSGISGQGIAYYGPYYLQVIEDKFAREISRRRGLVFNIHSGQGFFLLKRREYGTYCTSCYDIELQRTTTSKCPVCYDTGYNGGYFGPIAFKGQLSERPVREMHQMFGTWQDQDSVLYTDATPTINPKDVIIDRLSRRWIALNVGSYSKAVHSLGQIVQLRQVEKDDVIYTFPVTY